MTCYFNVIGFLNDEELHQVWDICAEAMERKGWDVDNSELSSAHMMTICAVTLTQTPHVNPNPVARNTLIIMSTNATNR